MDQGVGLISPASFLSATVRPAILKEARTHTPALQRDGLVTDTWRPPLGGQLQFVWTWRPLLKILHEDRISLESCEVCRQPSGFSTFVIHKKRKERGRLPSKKGVTVWQSSTEFLLPSLWWTMV